MKRTSMLVLAAALCARSSTGMADDAPAQPADPPAPRGKAYLLRYKFRPNQRVDFEVKHESTIRLVKSVKRSTTFNASTSRKHFTVVSVDQQGNAILVPTIDWVTMSLQFDDDPKKTYDSRSKAKADRRFAGVAKTIGKALVQLKVAANGKLIKAVPMIPQQVQRAVVKNAGPPRRPDDASKNFLVVFPVKAVRVGESWTDQSLTVHLQVGTAPRVWQKFTILRRYDLVSVKDGRATLELSMAPKKPVHDPQLRAQLVQRLISGTIVLDLERGLIVSRRLKVDEKVLGIAGNQSILHVKSLRTERLLTPGDVAQGPKPAKN